LSSPTLAALALLGALNLATWVAFRVDKARARRGTWRIRERTLLGLAVAGGALGALAAMYGHRRRHKTAKPRFVAVVGLALVAQLAGAAWLWSR
jgi:uncharacterized membrane protein YsdA (DUF1294 family)